MQFALTLNEDASLWIIYDLEVLVIRHAQKLEDHDYFVGVCVTWEKHGSLHELCENAASRPHVKTLVVRLVQKTDLGSPIPSSHDIGSLLEDVFHFAKSSAKAKVANLQVALGVDKNVGRLQVPMHDVCCVHVVDSSHDLIHEVLIVIRLQFLS